LVRPFEEDEVFGVIQGFNGDMAPGVDGFSMAFFQSCWHILNRKLWSYFRIFTPKLFL